MKEELLRRIRELRATVPPGGTAYPCNSAYAYKELAKRQAEEQRQREIARLYTKAKKEGTIGKRASKKLIDDCLNAPE